MGKYKEEDVNMEMTKLRDDDDNDDDDDDDAQQIFQSIKYI